MKGIIKINLLIALVLAMFCFSSAAFAGVTPLPDDDDDDCVGCDVQKVPEPSTLLLLASGAGIVLAGNVIRRRRKK